MIRTCMTHNSGWDLHTLWYPRTHTEAVQSSSQWYSTHTRSSHIISVSLSV